MFTHTLSMCWSVCESLLAMGSAHTLFATHYTELSELATMYVNVSNFHFPSKIVQGTYWVCEYGFALLRLFVCVSERGAK